MPFTQNISSYHCWKNPGVNNMMNGVWILFSCFRFRTPVMCMLAHCHRLHRCPLLMSWLETPAPFCLWKVKLLMALNQIKDIHSGCFFFVFFFNNIMLWQMRTHWTLCYLNRTSSGQHHVLAKLADKNWPDMKLIFKRCEQTSFINTNYTAAYKRLRAPRTNTGVSSYCWLHICSGWRWLLLCRVLHQVPRLRTHAPLRC